MPEKEEGRVLLTSDPHLGHANIIRYCARPYRNTDEMNRDIVRRWNRAVSPQDTVIDLGDVSSNPQRHVHRLNGKHILIQGNHDRRKKNHLYAEVHRHMSMRIGKWDILLIHRPVRGEGPLEKQPTPQEVLDLADKHDFVVCGHVHDKWLSSGRNLNLGMDVWGFTPVTLERVEAALAALAALPPGQPLDRSVAESDVERACRLSEVLDMTELESLPDHPAWSQLVDMGAACVPHIFSLGSGWAEELLASILKVDPEARRELEREKRCRELRGQGMNHKRTDG